LVFIIAAFFYVLVEQGIGTWLPTFNQEILKLPTALSIQMASVFAAALAVGRLLAGQVLQRVHWLPFLVVCSLGMALLILVSLPMAQQAASQTQVISGWQDVPLAGWLFPLIGLFMAPIYPAINSVVLSALPKQQHASMTGLIVVFSALGGTSGSLLTGLLFGYFADERAFYFVLVPLAVLLAAFWQLNRFAKS
jgi:fucose permease